jgi:hypothetical protein
VLACELTGAPNRMRLPIAAQQELMSESGAWARLFEWRRITLCACRSVNEKTMCTAAADNGCFIEPGLTAVARGIVRQPPVSPSSL